MRARGNNKWKSLCVQVSHNILHLFCFLLIPEHGSILREKKILARKSTFRIIPLQLWTFTEREKVAPGSWLYFCFSAEVNIYKGKIRKIDYRGALFLFFRFSENRSALKDEQKTKKEQNVMTDLHAKVFPSTFASSSHNLKKMF